MSVAQRIQLCFCGSGRAEQVCHELPRSERRRRKKELDVLAEAHDLAALFPEVRPRDAIFDAFAERAAATLDPDGPRPTTDLIEEGLTLLDDGERRRIVESWSLVYPDRWGALVADGGSEPLIWRAVVCGAVGVAILERCPSPTMAFLPYEGGFHQDVPANALTLAIQPPSVWSIDEAVVAASLHPKRSKDFDPDWFDATADYGARSMRDGHRLRFRSAVGRIEAQLPIVGLPNATQLVRDGCVVLLGDDGWCNAIGGRLLALYADSPLVERELAAQARHRAGRRVR